MIDRLPDLIPWADKYFAAKIQDVFGGGVDPDTVDIDYRPLRCRHVLAER